MNEEKGYQTIGITSYFATGLAVVESWSASLFWQLCKSGSEKSAGKKRLFRLDVSSGHFLAWSKKSFLLSFLSINSIIYLEMLSWLARNVKKVESERDLANFVQLFPNWFRRRPTSCPNSVPKCRWSFISVQLQMSYTSESIALYDEKPRMLIGAPKRNDSDALTLEGL